MRTDDTAQLSRKDEPVFRKRLTEHIRCLERLQGMESQIVSGANMMVTALRAGGAILVAGNGGSAADAQHFAAELVGRFQRERRPYRAVALTTDTSILTAVGNDYGFDDVFSRQVLAHSRRGDVFVGISTSGNSTNIVRAVQVAKESGLGTIGMLGRRGGMLRELFDVAVVVPEDVTARIQEAHQFVLHYCAEQIENELV